MLNILQMLVFFVSEEDVTTPKNIVFKAYRSWFAARGAVDVHIYVTQWNQMVICLILELSGT